MGYSLVGQSFYENSFYEHLQSIGYAEGEFELCIGGEARWKTGDALTDKCLSCSFEHKLVIAQHMKAG